MKTITVVCDQCGHDLTETGNCVDYRLVLANESIPSRGGFVTSAAAYPAIDRTAHFCGVSCLAAWMVEKYPDALTSYRKLQEHRQWMALSPEEQNAERAREWSDRRKERDAKLASQGASLTGVVQ